MTTQSLKQTKFTTINNAQKLQGLSLSKQNFDRVERLFYPVSRMNTLPIGS